MNSWLFCWACDARASRWRCMSWKARASSGVSAINHGRRPRGPSRSGERLLWRARSRVRSDYPASPGTSACIDIPPSSARSRAWLSSPQPSALRTAARARRASPPSCARPCAAASRRGHRPSSRRSRNAPSGWACRSPRTAARGGCRCCRIPAHGISCKAARDVWRASRRALQHAHARRIAMGTHVGIQHRQPILRPVGFLVHGRHDVVDGRQTLDRMAPVAVQTTNTP